MVGAGGEYGVRGALRTLPLEKAAMASTQSKRSLQGCRIRSISKAAEVQSNAGLLRPRERKYQEEGE